MIAYNEKALDQLMINEEARKAQRKHLISKEEFEAIATAHPVKLYRPNIFIRIGLFIVTVIIVMMSFGLIMLFVGYEFIICAILLCAALEGLINKKKHYRSGVDDALLWMAFGFIVASVNLFGVNAELPQSILIFALSLFATLRFANSVMSGVMFLSFLAVIFYSVIPFGPIAKSILPFLMMVISVFIYWIVIKFRNRQSLRLYKYCLLMIEVLSLVAIYASVNYFAVRELSNELFDLHLPEGAPITGGWFFWITTLVIPPLYIFRALQKKDTALLRIGMLLLAATVLTIRHYYSVAPVEQVMTAGGALLISAAYFIIKFLKSPKYGITDKEPENEEPENALQLEALVVAETFHNTPLPGNDDGFKFGGGSSGGGGASGDY